MEIYNENGQVIGQDEADLSKGRLVRVSRIRADASPVDNEKKFAYADEDYEEVQIYYPYSQEQMSELNKTSPDEDRDAMLVDMEYRLTMVEIWMEQNGVDVNAVSNFKKNDSERAN